MPTLRRSFLPILVALTLVAAACGSGADSEQVSTQRASDSPGDANDAPDADASEADAPDDGGEAGGDGGEVGVDAGSSGTTRDAPGRGAESSSGANGDGTGAATPAPAPPTSSDAFQPAAPGLYAYDTDGTSETSGPLGGTSDLPEETTLTVEAPDGGRQRAVRDLRDAAGEGTVTTTDVLYQDDGVYLEYLKIAGTNSGITVTFEFVFDPPQIIIPTGAEVGYHNQFSTTSVNGGITADVEVDITGEETLTIGGVAVDTFVLVTHTTFDGDIEGEATLTDNVDPERSLRVREDLVSDTRLGGTETHTESVSTLRSLEPR